MNRVSREEIMQAAAERRERIRGYMTQDPPLSVKQIVELEGMTDRSCRILIREIDKEFSIGYMAMKLRPDMSATPFGLTPSTLRLRQKLGDHLYMLVERGTEGNKIGRNSVAPRVGLNGREQLRAEQRPFNHDWRLSQIERLARELNRDPREFLLSCLTG